MKEIISKVPAPYKEDFTLYITTGKASPQFLQELQTNPILDQLANQAMDLLIHNLMQYTK